MMTPDDLRAWRARRRWTQEQAARELGFSRKTYQKSESLDGKVSKRMALAVAGLDAQKEQAQ